VHYDVINKVHRLGDIHDATEVSAEHGAQIIKIINESIGIEDPTAVAAATNNSNPAAAVEIGAPQLAVAPVAATVDPYLPPNSASSAPPHQAVRYHDAAAATTVASYHVYQPPAASPPRKRGRSPLASGVYNPPQYMQQQV